MKILAIESSCDETSASILEKTPQGMKVHASVTATSLSLHATTGGIIPENAARMQVTYIMPVIIKALSDAFGNDSKIALKENVDAIAVTFGPGLIGSLLVGVETAKTLAYSFNKPLIPVNHLLGHIYANFIDGIDKIEFPFIGLIVSGGHTDLLHFKNHGEYEWLGGTRDDAAGEAFDKIGRVLGLSYPAGPEIEKRAAKSNKHDIKFKSPLINEDNFDFSFSGLKTEAIRYYELHKKQKGDLQENDIDEICYATQKAIVDVLIKKTLVASEKFNCSTILIGGGVSANQTFINGIKEKASTMNIQVFSPPSMYCTDNAAMIGSYALLNHNPIEWKDVNANPELYFG